MVRERSYQQTVGLFTKNSKDTDKPVPVLNLPSWRFKGTPSNKVRTGNIQGVCDSDISVSAIISVGVPVEEVLLDIKMNARRVVIHL